jgi:hypothetical protein
MYSIPILDKNSYNCSIELKFNYDDFIKFNKTVKNNPGLKTKEYIKLMTFYDFNEETLEYAFKLFNTHKNTFYNFCGPFMFNSINKTWYLQEYKIKM